MATWLMPRTDAYPLPPSGSGVARAVNSQRCHFVSLQEFFFFLNKRFCFPQRGLIQTTIKLIYATPPPITTQASFEISARTLHPQGHGHKPVPAALPPPEPWAHAMPCIREPHGKLSSTAFVIVRISETSQSRRPK